MARLPGPQARFAGGTRTTGPAKLFAGALRKRGYTQPGDKILWDSGNRGFGDSEFRDVGKVN